VTQAALPVAPSPAPPTQHPPEPRRPSLVADAQIENVAVRGSLARAVVARALSRAASDLRACYAAAAARAQRDAAASVPVSLVIDENGLAREVTVGTAPLPGLDRCAKDVASAIRSQAPDVGEVRVSFTVRFTPAGSQE
jgi:hypothetical protein